MIFIETDLPKVHKIYYMGDSHDGSANRHKAGMLAIIDRVAKEKNSYMVFMGDAIEGVAVDDKRYIQESVDVNASVPLLQAQNVIKEFTPIKHKILAWLVGNHEITLLKFGNLTRDVMCKELGVPYGTYACVVTVKVEGKQSYKIYAQHGRKSIGSTSEDPKRRKANMEYQLKKHLYKKMADCLVMAEGHMHKLILSEPEPELQIVSDGKKLHQTYTRNPGNVREIPHDLRYYLGTGTYRSLYGALGTLDYSEIASYDPEELGCISLQMENGIVVEAKKEIV